MSEKLQFSYADPRLLKKNDWNPNQVSSEAMLKLKKSIQENGHIRPILVRELSSGELEIVGGEHRCEISIDLGQEQVPILNLGRISDKEAKKLLLLDNSRYGEDDIGKLSSLLGDIGSAEELASFMMYSEDDLSSLMVSDSKTDLDDLDELDELDYIDDEEPATAPSKEIRTHQTLKIKVPVENADLVIDLIEKIAKEQGIEDSDAMVRSGEALTWLVRNYLEDADYSHDDDLDLTAEVDDILEMDELAELDELELDQE